MAERPEVFETEADHLLWYMRNEPDTGIRLGYPTADQMWESVSVYTLGEALHELELRKYGLDLDLPAKTAFEFEVVADHEDDWSLQFSDGSGINDPLGEVGRANVREPVDVGLHLLDPISRRELAAIEPLLGELWSALNSDALSETQRHQIVAMAALIKSEQHAAVPGETQRWKLVGTVRSALRYLAKDVPKDALAWWKLIELLEKIDWTTIAGELPGL